MRLIVIVPVVVLAASAPATAYDAVSETMSCGAVRKAFDAEPPDRDQDAAISRTVTKLLVDLDRASANKGGAMIFLRMNDAGKANTMAMVTVHCGDEPKATLRQSASYVYKGLYAIGRSLGVNR